MTWEVRSARFFIKVVPNPLIRCNMYHVTLHVLTHTSTRTQFPSGGMYLDRT